MCDGWCKEFHTNVLMSINDYKIRNYERFIEDLVWKVFEQERNT